MADIAKPLGRGRSEEPARLSVQLSVAKSLRPGYAALDANPRGSRQTIADSSVCLVSG